MLGEVEVSIGDVAYHNGIEAALKAIDLCDWDIVRERVLDMYKDVLRDYPKSEGFDFFYVRKVVAEAGELERVVILRKIIKSFPRLI